MHSNSPQHNPTAPPVPPATDAFARPMGVVLAERSVAASARAGEEATGSASPIPSSAPEAVHREPTNFRTMKAARSALREVLHGRSA